MTKDFTVTDRRGGKEESQSPALPSALRDELEEVLLKPGEQFVHPTAGRILIQGDFALSKVGRIIIPDKVKKAPTTGVILEVGPGVENYQPGQKVVFGLYSGTVLTYKGWDPKTRINFRILSVDEILATQDEKAPELEGVGV